MTLAPRRRKKAWPKNVSGGVVKTPIPEPVLSGLTWASTTTTFSSTTVTFADI